MIREKIKHDGERISREYTSLRFVMLSMLLVALGIAISLFLVFSFVGEKYIELNYMSEEKRLERENEYKSDLQEYVTEQGLGCDDAQKISEWTKKNKYLYVLVYKGDDLLFESGQEEENSEVNTPEMGENKENADDVQDNLVESDNDSDSDDKSENKKNNTGITVKTPTREELIAEAIAGGSYSIEAADGVLHVCMVDYTEYMYYDAVNILSFAIAFLGFVLIMWLYFFNITRRITRLGKEVTAIADGEVDHPITADGEDEITKLCNDVEYMRNSMLENIEKERAALESNRELITAMSHDIRTPLTVLLGYLDIMKLNATDEDMQQYLEVTERTALRLKKMSDDMFGYFLVYGGGIEVEVQECDARTLVDQMLSGHVFLLREQGYEIEFNLESENNDFLSDVIVVTDPPQLMRIVENIFSNIMKYADKEKPVSVYAVSDTDELTIKISNSVAQSIDSAQKNGIGLRSCMKLANAMDIRFSSEESDGVFTSLMHIPIIPDIEYTDEVVEEGGFSEWLRSVFEKFKSYSMKIWRTLKDLITKKE